MRCFRGRRPITAGQRGQNVRRRNSLDQARDANGAAVGFHDLVPHDFRGRVRATLDEHVGTNGLEQPARRFVVEADGRLAGADLVLAGLPLAVGFTTGFFFAGIGMVMPGIAE